MNGLRISTLLALAFLLALLLGTSAGAQFNPQPLYEYAATYTVWSDVSDGVYWWAVRNERTDATMIGWTTGANSPIGTIPRAATIPEAVFPLPTVQPTLPRPWFNAFLSSPLAPMVVESTLFWSDGTSANVPVYMPLVSLEMKPSYIIPEPSGLLSLALGIAGLGMGLRRKLR